MDFIGVVFLFPNARFLRISSIRVPQIIGCFNNGINPQQRQRFNDVRRLVRQSGTPTKLSFMVSEIRSNKHSTFTGLVIKIHK
jgi:hypothetical protein